MTSMAKKKRFSPFPLHTEIGSPDSPLEMASYKTDFVLRKDGAKVFTIFALYEYGIMVQQKGIKITNSDSSRRCDVSILSKTKTIDKKDGFTFYDYHVNCQYKDKKRSNIFTVRCKFYLNYASLYINDSGASLEARECIENIMEFTLSIPPCEYDFSNAF